jgi:regulator of sigma E protease
MTELTGANRIIAFTVERQGKLVNLTVTPRADEKTGGAGSAGWFPQSEVIVKGVNLDMDAAKQGLKPGDVILAVNNVAIRSVGKLHEVVRSTEGKTAEVLFARNGERQTIRVTPSFKQVEGEAKPRYLLGVTLEPKVELVALPFPEAFNESLKRNWKDAGMIYGFLRGMVEARVSPKQLEGPVRIAQIAREAAKEGFWPFVGLMSMVSLNLAIFNLLPIPILDGGVILMLLIEMIARRDLSVRVKETILKVAFVFLITLVVFVLYNDIAKVLRG